MVGLFALFFARASLHLNTKNKRILFKGYPLVFPCSCFGSLSVQAHSILPKPPKLPTRELCINHCVRNVRMTKIHLYRSQVCSFVGQVKTASMPQHMRMHREFYSRYFPSFLNHPINYSIGDGAFPFA